jgi:hypothetical protein
MLPINTYDFHDTASAELFITWLADNCLTAFEASVDAGGRTPGPQ